MKLKELIEKFKRTLPNDYREYTSPSDFWNVYSAFSGYNEEEYFNIFFNETSEGITTIQIAYTTDNPDYWIKKIKDIDENAKVQYAITNIKYKTV